MAISINKLVVLSKDKQVEQPIVEEKKEITPQYVQPSTELSSELLDKRSRTGKRVSHFMEHMTTI